MREGIAGIREVLVEAGRLLSADELAIASSVDLAPGLVRTSGRAELVKRPATVLKPDADASDGEATKGRTV